MITGDYHHTAVAVAKTVGMVKPDSQVVVIDTLQKDVDFWSHDQRHRGPSRSASQAATGSMMSPLTSPQPSIWRQDSELAHADTPKVSHKSQVPVVAVEAKVFATASVEAKRGPSLGRRVSFQVPRLLQLSASFGSRSIKVAPDSIASPCSLPGAVALLNRGPSEAALLNKQPSEAALLDRQPIETAWLSKLPSGSKLSPRNNLPACDSVSLEVPLARIQSGQATLRRSVSLSRLPCQVSLPTASLLPDSAVDDSAIEGMMHEPRSPSMHPVTHLPIPALGSMRASCNTATHNTHPLLLPSVSAIPLRGLTFTPAGSQYHMDPHEAITAISEGSMQCAVTGYALEHLLQLPDVSLLEAVMRNAVVFSRMQVCRRATCSNQLPALRVIASVLLKPL